MKIFKNPDLFRLGFFCGMMGLGVFVFQGLCFGFCLYCGVFGGFGSFIYFLSGNVLQCEWVEKQSF